MSLIIQNPAKTVLARLEPKPSKKTGEIRVPLSAARGVERLVAGELYVRFKVNADWVSGKLVGVEDSGKVHVETARGRARVWADLVFDLESNKKGEITRGWQRILGLHLLQESGKLAPEFTDIDA